MASLVTGLGYIGSALAQRLIGLGEDVIGLESFFSTPRACLNPILGGGGLTLVEGSITDPAALKQAFSVGNVETVFHLAAQASARPDAASLAYTQETNFTGPRMLLDACRKHGVKHVVLASSMRLYRTPLPRVVTEQSPIDPTDLVHLSQLYGEVLLAEHRRRDTSAGGADQLPFTSIAARLGIVHGVSPVMKSDPRFLAAPQLFCLQAARGEWLNVNGGAGAILAFVHISDAVEALIRCRDLPPETNLVNVAAEVRSVASVATEVQLAGARRGLVVRIHHQGRGGDPAARSVRSGLDSTGFRPSRRIEESIGDVLDYYLTDRASVCASS